MDKETIERMAYHLRRMKDALDIAQTALRNYQAELKAYEEAKTRLTEAEDAIDEGIINIFRSITGKNV